MNEEDTSGPVLPAPPRPVSDDRILTVFADTLDVAAVYQRHPDWNRERLCALLGLAARRLRPSDQPSPVQHMEALLAIAASVLAGWCFLAFGDWIAPLLEDLQSGCEYALPRLTRLALFISSWRPDPAAVLGLVLLLIYALWACRSQKRLRWFTSGTYVCGLILGMLYLMGCLHPLIALWLRLNGRGAM